MANPTPPTPPPPPAAIDRSPERLIAPVRPNDSLSFDELLSSYNFANISDRRSVLTRAIIEECGKRDGTARVLDIGCGRGMGRNSDYVRAVKPHAAEMWGIEPAEDVTPPEGIFDQFQHALMETAQLPENHFDIAYSFMVMEHVADPVAYMKALSRVLKPGGVYFFVTPNGGHYFTLIASAMKKIKLDEVVLRLVQGKSLVDDYHYPVQYKFNKLKQIRRVCDEAGDLGIDLVYMESEGPRSYMKGPLILLFHLLQLKRRMIRSRRALLSIVGRITKRPAP
ncbi:MAG: 2-polyprenyl-3-methyl-5-hydroxy-6-metoxy-1,4-benzoquinol methylase [Phycisphaerales bacterium]|jgi:2-polyprenyl-3-methyl-5-hydroxy-6-metoxy-1,4-benzoquinol methylase